LLVVVIVVFPLVHWSQLAIGDPTVERLSCRVHFVMERLDQHCQQGAEEATVVVHLADGTSVRAHRRRLSQSSAYFAALCQGPSQRSSDLSGTTALDLSHVTHLAPAEIRSTVSIIAGRRGTSAAASANHDGDHDERPHRDDERHHHHDDERWSAETVTLLCKALRYFCLSPTWATRIEGAACRLVLDCKAVRRAAGRTVGSFASPVTSPVRAFSFAVDHGFHDLSALVWERAAQLEAEADRGNRDDDDDANTALRLAERWATALGKPAVVELLKLVVAASAQTRPRSVLVGCKACLKVSRSGVATVIDARVTTLVDVAFADGDSQRLVPVARTDLLPNRQTLPPTGAGRRSFVGLAVHRAPFRHGTTLFEGKVTRQTEGIAVTLEWEPSAAWGRAETVVREVALAQVDLQHEEPLLA
jgi:hypothetical protein